MPNIGSSRENYSKVIKYIVDAYYNDSKRVFSLKSISNNTNTDTKTVKDTLSVLDRKTDGVFKLKYNDILKLEQIRDLDFRKKISLFSMCIAIFSFLIAFIALFISVYVSDINNWFKIIIYIASYCFFILIPDYIFNRILFK